jgi:hypothetical protein
MAYWRIRAEDAEESGWLGRTEQLENKGGSQIEFQIALYLNSGLTCAVSFHKLRIRSTFLINKNINTLF